MASPGPQTATAARRWAARVAVVVGGVGAASAAAWVLSTATAGAAQVDPLDPGAAVEQIAKSAGEALQDTVDRVGNALRNTGPHIGPQPSQPGPPASDEQTSEPAPVVEPRADDPEPPLGAAAQDALATFDDFLSRLLGGGQQPPWPSEPIEPPACAPEFQDFCERVGEWFGPKPGDLVPGIPPVDDLPLPDTGTDELPALPGTGPSTVTKPIVSAGAVESAVEALTDTAAVSSISPRGDPRHTDFPGGGSALSLPGMPALAAPGSGAAGAGHADGAPLAITAAQAATAVGNAGQALPHHTPGSSSRGGQPGVTPD